MCQFEGILLTLKKRMQSVTEEDGQFYKFHMLGYYDGLDINYIEKWYDFRPKGLKERDLQTGIKNPFADQYTIRAFVPKEKSQLENSGFNYSVWEQISNNEQNADLLCGKPFIVMSVINLTREYVRENNEFNGIFMGFAKVIENYFGDNKTLFRDLNCAVFPSVGYSDLVILCLTDNLSKVAAFIEYIRGSVSENGNNIVSNCYSICGFHKNYFIHKQKSQDNAVKMTIRINLKEGITAKQFFSQLIAELKKDDQISRKEIEDIQEEISKTSYCTFGNTDCLLMPVCLYSKYLQMHAPDNLLNPGHDFFKKYISNIQTEVHVIRKYQNETISFEPPRRSTDVFNDKFEVFIDKYETFLQKNNFHMRSSGALQQIMKNFLNIVCTGHGFDNEQILGNAFTALINNMNYYMSEKTDMSEEDERCWHKTKYEVVEAVGKFRDIIGMYIADLVRSDRPFFEGNSLTHPSIGSATKLLFAYNVILNRVLNEFGERKNYTFVVVSGGCDVTEAIDLFSMATPDEKLNKIILIQIPEMSLYDIQGTLFRILHECMHFIGDRKRECRYKFLLQSLANEIAWDICEAEFISDQKKYFLKNFDILNDNLKRKLFQYFDVLWAKKKRECIRKIADYIIQIPVFADYFKDARQEDLCMYILTYSVLSHGNMIKAFRGDELCEKERLQNQIYEVFYETNKEIINDVCGYLKKMQNNSLIKNERVQIKMVLKTFELLKQHYIIWDEKENYIDRKLQRFIQNFMDEMMDSQSIFSSSEDTLCENPYQELLDAIVFAMKECFADCVAIKCIDLQKEDFLLSFIYELWDIDKAFPDTMGNILRIGLDMKVMYQEEGRLSKEARHNIAEKVKLRNEQGYPYKNAEQMLDRVDHLLESYQIKRTEGMCQPLEAYLAECVKLNAICGLNELNRICSMSQKDDIYEVLDHIMLMWKSLGGEEKNEGK